VLGISRVAVVATRNDGVEEFLEELERFFITGNQTDSLDLRVAGVVHAGLEAMGQLDAELGLFVLEVGPDLAGAIFVQIGGILEDVGDESVVFLEVRELSGVVVEGRLLLFGDVALTIGASQLDPLLELGAVFGAGEITGEAVGLGEFGTIRSGHVEEESCW